LTASKDGMIEIQHSAWEPQVADETYWKWVEQDWREVSAQSHSDDDQQMVCRCQRCDEPAEVDLLAAGWAMALCSSHAKHAANIAKDIRAMMEIDIAVGALDVSE
jgi:hypothetical protein